MDYNYIPELPTENGPYQVIDIYNNCEVRIYYDDFQTSNDWLREVVCWKEL